MLKSRAYLHICSASNPIHTPAHVLFNHQATADSQTRAHYFCILRVACTALLQHSALKKTFNLNVINNYVTISFKLKYFSLTSKLIAINLICNCLMPFRYKACMCAVFPRIERICARIYELCASHTYILLSLCVFICLHCKCARQS